MRGVLGVAALVVASSLSSARDAGGGEATLRVRLTRADGRRTSKFLLRLGDGGVAWALENAGHLGVPSELLPRVPEGVAMIEGRFDKPEFHCQLFAVEVHAQTGEQLVELTEQPTRSISGRVLQDGQPAAGVLVHIDDEALGRDRCVSHTALSDSRGRFQSTSIGVNPVVVTARGQSRKVSDGGALVIDVPPAVAGVHGRFIGSRTLFSGKRVSVVVPDLQSTSEQEWTFDVNDDGVFGFDEAPDGGLGFLLSSAEGADAQPNVPVDTFFVLESPTREARVDLAKMGTLVLSTGNQAPTRGTLVFPNGVRWPTGARRLRLPEGPVEFWYRISEMEPDHFNARSQRCEVFSAVIVRGKETRLKLVADPRNPTCPEAESVGAPE